MKAFYVMFVVFAVLLLGAPMASAQDGWPGCPWGDAWDPMIHGYVPACFSLPTDDAAALKTAGLAKLAPIEDFVPCGTGENVDPLLDPRALACLSQPFPAAKAVSKPAGLAAPAPAVIPKQGWPGCLWGDAYNPSLHGFVSECDIRPTDNAAALKPAGLAAPAPAVIPEQGWPGCPWGYGFNPMIHGDVLECLDRPTDNSAALKPAGLAAPAPAWQQFGPCSSSGESPDPLAWPLACLR